MGEDARDPARTDDSPFNHGAMIGNRRGKGYRGAPVVVRRLSVRFDTRIPGESAGSRLIFFT